jgi:hypothetical protein
MSERAAVEETISRSATMNLLDERIDYHQSMDRETWAETPRRTLLQTAQYKCIADTIVQLIRRVTSGVIRW